MLGDRGVLERRGDIVELASDAVISVPETVQALIAARLDTLPPDRKALMYDAAVLGRVFWSGGAAAMAGRPEVEVRQFLHELARKELVRPARRPSIEGQAEYAFWHVVVQDVAYRQIPRAARSSKHRAAAEWLEGVAGQRVGDHAEISRSTTRRHCASPWPWGRRTRRRTRRSSSQTSCSNGNEPIAQARSGCGPPGIDAGCSRCAGRRRSRRRRSRSCRGPQGRRSANRDPDPRVGRVDRACAGAAGCGHPARARDPHRGRPAPPAA